MVVFTCGHCGESVQKPKVEKHYMTKCRNRNPNLSCMDCFKDFGQDYEAHTKCVTEEERYSGKGFISKEKKGEKKQNAWVEMLQSVLDEQKSAPGNVLRIIETISKLNNTPRKKGKFINFVKNVCGQKTNSRDIDQAWDLISVKLLALYDINNQNRINSQKNDTSNINNKDAAKEQNGDADNDEGNLNDVDKSNTEDNIETKTEGQNGESEVVEEKKLTKKQRKEEKKRQKYEAELQSAEAPVEEEEETETKQKGKKKKNRTNSTCNEDAEEPQDGKNKHKKRKRVDTVNGIQEATENGTATVETEIVSKEKTQKKKLKVDAEEEADESICLHDQNVAKIGELAVNSDSFNWHAVIISLLQKKGNELPFKRLQKKVLGEFMEYTGQDVDDRIADKFIKKLRSAPNVRVDKNRVVLIE